MELTGERALAPERVEGESRPFPVARAADLEARPRAHRWLVEGLWSAEAVGIIGGEPKCCKSFLALELAVSVASGAPCLRRFPCRDRGSVLIYAAEEPLHIVRERLEGITAASGLSVPDLDLLVITAPRVRLDLDEDRARLRRTVASTRPKLLVLDPLVRLHQIDENGAGGMAELLGFLREMEREFHVAVALVHHAKKSAARTRAGQALRGSSELHAWGDSNLYMRRHGDTLTLSVEHRAAASLDPFRLELREDGPKLSLELVDPEGAEAIDPEPDTSLERRIMSAFEAAGAGATLSFRALRNHCRVRNKRLSDALAELSVAGSIERTDLGYRLGSPGFGVTCFPLPTGAGNG
ncbi:MAG TPA: AAA family ATPase [Planctomycetota bacterium]|nr:AAA family ATPase [Planctomycetota bacterium]